MGLKKNLSSSVHQAPAPFDLLPNEVILKIVKMAAIRDCECECGCGCEGPYMYHCKFRHKSIKNDRQAEIMYDRLRKCHEFDGTYTRYNHKFINEVICKMSTRFKTITMGLSEVTIHMVDGLNQGELLTHAINEYLSDATDLRMIHTEGVLLNGQKFIEAMDSLSFKCPNLKSLGQYAEICEADP